MSSTPSTDSTSPKPGGARSLVVYGVMLAALFAYSVFTATWSYGWEGEHHGFVGIVNPLVVAIVDWLVLIGVIVLALASIGSFIRQFLRWPAIGLLICLLVYPLSLGSHALGSLALWTTHGEVSLDDGGTYVFLDSSFLQGQIMAIARQEHDFLLVRTFQVLVMNNGDSPRSWASVIRPADPEEHYGQLYLGRDNLLVGIRYDNRCFLAYDLTNNTAFGHGDIEAISPFVCLPEGVEPYGADVETTCDRIREYGQFCAESIDHRFAEGFLAGEPVPGCPPLAAIRDALRSREAGVAIVAAELESSYKEAFSPLVESSPDQDD